MNDILQTGALETAITKESIKQLMDGFDPATTSATGATTAWAASTPGGLPSVLPA